MLFDPGCATCGCPPPGLCAVYTVMACSGTPLESPASPGYIVPGATVRIRTASGGTIVAEGVTDSFGQVTLCVPTAGNRWVEAELPGRFALSGAMRITGTTAYTLTVAPVSGSCCMGGLGNQCTPPYVEHGPLYLTDAGGTWAPAGTCALTWNTIIYHDSYVCSCFPNTVAVESRPIAITYQAFPSITGSFVLQRRWRELTPGPCLFTDPPIPPAYLPAWAACRPPVIGDYVGVQGASTGGGGSCTAPVWTFSGFSGLPGETPQGPDPVSGSVVLSY